MKTVHEVRARGEHVRRRVVVVPETEGVTGHRLLHRGLGVAAEGAALLVDHVLPAVGYRQWVLSFPGPMAVRL